MEPRCNPSGIKLEIVALHEIGHALGLEHSGDRTSILFPIYQGDYDLDQLSIDSGVKKLKDLYSEENVVNNKTPWKDEGDRNPGDHVVQITFRFLDDDVTVQAFQKISDSWKPVIIQQLDRWQNESPVNQFGQTTIEFIPWQSDVENSPSDEADLHIGAGPMDGRFGILAEAEFPSTQGEKTSVTIRFDSEESWVTGQPDNPPDVEGENEDSSEDNQGNLFFIFVPSISGNEIRSFLLFQSPVFLNSNPASPLTTLNPVNGSGGNSTLTPASNRSYSQLAVGWSVDHSTFETLEIPRNPQEARERLELFPMEMVPRPRPVTPPPLAIPSEPTSPVFEELDAPLGFLSTGPGIQTELDSGEATRPGNSLNSQTAWAGLALLLGLVPPVDSTERQNIGKIRVKKEIPAPISDNNS